MAEEKQEKKKLWLVKQILSWISLGPLALLVILAIIFQAPWKVTALLVIFFLACTVLPKPYRKWFWLSAGAVVIALIIWVFLPEDNEGWRPYTFDKELAALEAKYAIPDEENAARIYNKLLEDYNEAAFEPNFLDPNLEDLTRKEPWSSRDYPEIAQWIKQHEGTITRLIEASKIEKCRFPINADPVAFSQSMERLSAMRRWAFLLCRAANNDLGENRIDQVIEKNLTVLQMGKHQCQQITIIDLLVGIAIEALATSQFKTFIVTGDATEERLSVIENALAEIKHDWSYDLPRVLEGEKLIFKNLLGMFYVVNPKGKVRLSRDPTVAIKSQFPQFQQEVPSLTYWRKKLLKASTILGWFFIPSTPQKAGKIIDESYEKNYPMAKPNFDWEKEPEESSPMLRFNYRYWVEHMTSIIGPMYYRIHDLYLRLACDIRGARIIIALRRYKNKTGSWPESLDEVKTLTEPGIFVDPFNNDSFIYKLTEENFTLYSKGKNNIDDDGKRGRWGEEQAGADDWLIWPRKGRKTQKGKANDQRQ